MAIQDHYNETVKVQRLTLVEGETAKQEYTDHLVSVKCCIQPLEASITQDINVGFGKDKLMFCDYCDIVEGDRIVHGSDIYRVFGIEKYDGFLGRVRQMEIMIRIFES